MCSPICPVGRKHCTIHHCACIWEKHISNTKFDRVALLQKMINQCKQAKSSPCFPDNGCGKPFFSNWTVLFDWLLRQSGLLDHQTLLEGQTPVVVEITTATWTGRVGALQQWLKRFLRTYNKSQRCNKCDVKRFQGTNCLSKQWVALCASELPLVVTIAVSRVLWKPLNATVFLKLVDFPHANRANIHNTSNGFKNKPA